METIVTKSYQGAQTRLLLPKVKDVAGVIGDNNSTRICFKIPKNYATGWLKYIEFDCYVTRDDTELKPSYLLDEHDSFIVPYEITESNIGKEVDYCLKLVSEDGEIVEKSELATLYFRDSCNGTNTEPEPYTDIVTLLYNNAFCNVSYSDPTDGAEQPQLTFTPLNPNGEPESVSLNIPYLDAQGHIPPRFIDKEIVVEIFKISTPDELITLEDAQIPDMALISEGDSSEPYYMDLYMLVGSDPTDIDNWYLIHTSNPVFTSIQTTDLTATNGEITEFSSEKIVADSISATSIEGTFSGNLTGNVTGNLSGNATTATTADNYNTTQGGIKNALDGKAPVNHASDATTYGVGSTSQYGHVKVDASMSESSTNPVQNGIIVGFVNSSIGTATANFLGTYYAGSHDPVEAKDLQIPQNDIDTMTEEQLNEAIIVKLGTKVSGQGNNDYLFVAINFTATVDVDEYRRFKYSAPPGQAPVGWLYEYTLNNSSFTQAQWDTINSLVINTSDPKEGVDVKDINTHMGDTKIHVPANTTAGQVLTSQSDGQPIWQTPLADRLVSQKLLSGNFNLPLLMAHNAITTQIEDIVDITYRNNSIYANPSTGSIFATKVYSNGSEAVNLADSQTISGAKTFSNSVTINSGGLTNPLVIKGNVPYVTYTNSSADILNGVYSQYITPRFSFTDKNGLTFGNMGPYAPNADTTRMAMEVYLRDSSGTNLNQATFNLRSERINNTLVSYATVSSRTYNASNTNDVLTIGSLQASTDVVHRSGDEDIAGIKTFSNPLNVSVNGYGMMNATNKGVATGELGTYAMTHAIQFYDKNSVLMGRITHATSSPSTKRSMELKVYATDGTNTYSNAITPFVTTSGEKFTLAGWRATPSETDEVLTRGNGVTLNTAQTINNTKTFNAKPYFMTDASTTTMELKAKVVKIGDTISQWTRFNQIQMSDAEGVATGYIQNDMRPGTTYAKVHELSLGVTNVAQSASQVIIRKASDGTGWVEASARAYNSSNTSDVVTIGTLQSSTDVVHRTGAESVGGAKTFTSATYRSTNKTGAQIQALTSWTWLNGIEWRTTDSTTKRVADIRRTVEYSNSQLRHRMDFNILDIVGTERGMSILFPEGGISTSGQATSAWMVAPWRTYNASNTGEVVTIGMLNTAMTLGGIKRFTENIIGNGDTRLLFNSYTLGTAPSSDTWSNGYRICDKDGQWISAFQTWLGSDGHNQARLITRDSASGTAGQLSVLSTYMTGPNRSYASAGNSDILTKGHVADMMSANVSNQQISLTSSRGVAVDSFTLNQMSSKNIVLPASSTQYQNVSVTFSAQSPADFSDYPYMASYSVTGLTADMYATVTFSEAQVSSGQYAPFCQTVAGAVRLYAKSAVGAQTIPTISVGMDDSSAQQSMSNFVTIDGTQTVTGAKAFTGKFSILQSNPWLHLTNTAITRTVTPSANKTMVVRFEDINEISVAQIAHTYYKDGDGRLRLSVENVVGNAVSELVLGSSSSSETFVRSSYRTYSSSNTDDVVTIGSLQASTDVVHTSGEETVNGTKKFTTMIRGIAGYICTDSSQTGIDGQYKLITKISKTPGLGVRNHTMIAMWSRQRDRNPDILALYTNSSAIAGFGMILRGNSDALTYIASEDTNYIYISIITPGTVGGAIQAVILNSTMDLAPSNVATISDEERFSNTVPGTEYRRLTP